MDNWAFAPYRSTRANSQSRGQGFDQCYPWRDFSALQGYRLHHLRHPVALSLTGRQEDQRSNEEPAERWDEENAVPGQVWQDVQGEIGRADS